jgi:hypothetical protein
VNMNMRRASAFIIASGLLLLGAGRLLASPDTEPVAPAIGPSVGPGSSDDETSPQTLSSEQREAAEAIITEFAADSGALSGVQYEVGQSGPWSEAGDPVGAIFDLELVKPTDLKGSLLLLDLEHSEAPAAEIPFSATAVTAVMVWIDFEKSKVVGFDLAPDSYESLNVDEKALWTEP